ncbi:hypothetical protein [Lysinibacillus sphaericus]|uniref:Uncharacterized protein n=1 Tax=Lysinibacillus sphaericus OT4b.31 TaxID=1285586 RepID=R7Z8T6_LYSSH|nr:hypothetical protein [Lysinibacillus sphaericus]EON70371.1 hypothetical protein H131_21707 [Lysinibacillus sphaericus OT4b.31]
MKGLSITSLVLSIIFFCIGFYRLVFYSNPESFDRDSSNAWVGGDAYNYIINGTQATAYFVLFAAFFIAFVLLKIALEMQETIESSLRESLRESNRKLIAEYKSINDKE